MKSLGLVSVVCLVGWVVTTGCEDERPVASLPVGGEPGTAAGQGNAGEPAAAGGAGGVSVVGGAGEGGATDVEMGGTGHMGVAGGEQGGEPARGGAAVVGAGGQGGG